MQNYQKILIVALFIFHRTLLASPFITVDPTTLDPFHTDVTLYASVNKLRTLETIQAPALEWDFSIINHTEIDVYIPVVKNIEEDQNLRRTIPNAQGLGDISVQFKYQFLNETN